MARKAASLVDEDLRDRASLRGHDVVVGVAVGHTEPLGEQLSDGGLADPHGADENDQRHRAHRIARLSRYERTLRRVSVTLSPPNFSATASARTRATMASATMPAAGTAHTSER
jgi:hypothetical protein